MGELSRMWREGNHRYRMIGLQCGNCGKKYFPPRDICPTCHRESISKMKEIPINGKGEVVTFTVVHDTPPSFSRQRPYVLAIIKLDDGPTLTAQIVDLPPTDVHIGMRVRSAFRKVSEDGKSGIIHYGYKFIKDF